MPWHGLRAPPTRAVSPSRCQSCESETDRPCGFAARESGRARRRSSASSSSEAVGSAARGWSVPADGKASWTASVTPFRPTTAHAWWCWAGSPAGARSRASVRPPRWRLRPRPGWGAVRGRQARSHLGDRHQLRLRRRRRRRVQRAQRSFLDAKRGSDHGRIVAAGVGPSMMSAATGTISTRAI